MGLWRYAAGGRQYAETIEAERLRPMSDEKDS
jgi:hypothetical protein